MKKNYFFFLSALSVTFFLFSCFDSATPPPAEPLSTIDDKLLELCQLIKNERVVPSINCSDAHIKSASFRKAKNLCNRQINTSQVQNYFELTNEQIENIIVAYTELKKNNKYNRKIRFYFGRNSGLNSSDLMMVGLDQNSAEIIEGNSVYLVGSGLPCPDLCDGVSKPVSGSPIKAKILYGENYFPLSRSSTNLCQ